MLPSVVLAALQPDLLVWLHDRHTEHEVFERIVGFMERSRRHRGPGGATEAHPPAIAFVDLAGYTELTAIGGDERAADFATEPSRGCQSRPLEPRRTGREAAGRRGPLPVRLRDRGRRRRPRAHDRDRRGRLAGGARGHRRRAIRRSARATSTATPSTSPRGSRAHAQPGELLIPSTTRGRSLSPSRVDRCRRGDRSRASPTRSASPDCACRRADGTPPCPTHDRGMRGIRVGGSPHGSRPRRPWPRPSRSSSQGSSASPR